MTARADHYLMQYQKPVTLRCPSIGCRMMLSVPANRRGQEVLCPYCKRVFVVPAAPPAATPTAPQVAPAPTPAQ